MAALGSIFRRLLRDKRGNAILEFAFVAPVFLAMIFGLMDIAQLFYARSLLEGAVEVAARTSSLESGDTAAADTIVRDMVREIAPRATVTSSRVSYFDFNDVQRAELWNDLDSNGSCDNDENYTDENGNGQWDADIGVSGNGGAGDVVVYDVTVSFERIFKIPMLGGEQVHNIEASAIKKNQPFADQRSYGSLAGTCA